MRPFIYFDHAATSYPKIPAVRQALSHCLRYAGGNPGRSGHPLAAAADALLFAGRCAVGDLCGGAPAERVILTPGATFSINLAVALFAKPGTRFLLGNKEHNAVYRTVHRFCRDFGGRISFFASEDPGSFEKKLAEGVDLVITLHASNVTGEVFPVVEMGRLCQRRGIPFLLDASQSAGHLPLAEAAGVADVLCAPGHKALGGIQGCGFALFGKEKLHREFLTGGSGSLSASPEMPHDLPDRYEAGTPPTPAIATMTAGIRHLLRRGLEPRRERITALWETARAGIAELPQAHIYSHDPRCGILAFNLGDIPSEELAASLAARGICVRGGLHCAPLAHRALGTEDGGCVRLSFGETNTKEEVLTLLRVLEELWGRGAWRE